MESTVAEQTGASNAPELGIKPVDWNGVLGYYSKEGNGYKSIHDAAKKSADTGWANQLRNYEITFNALTKYRDGQLDPNSPEAGVARKTMAESIGKETSLMTSWHFPKDEETLRIVHSRQTMLTSALFDLCLPKSK